MIARHLWIVEWQSGADMRELAKRLDIARLYRVPLGEPVKVLPAKEKR